MSYRNFSDYVSSFSEFENNLALTMKPFIKIERLNYRQLRLRAYQVANYLSASGLHQGDRVMVIANNSPQWVELFLATQLIGVILVPVDAGSTLQTTERFIKETYPKIIFKSRYLHPEIDKQATTVVLDELDELVHGFSADPPKYIINDDYPALIVFTSGTTADPKGVVLSQHNILANISGIQKKINVGSDWRLLSVLPLSHMYELTGSLCVLSRGASIFYIPRVTPLAIGQALVDYRINTILAIPQLLILLLERIQQTAAEEGKAWLLTVASKTAAVMPFHWRRWLFHSVHARLGGQLNLVVTGGAPIPLEVATAWERMGVKMVQGYGLTETSPILTVNGLAKRRQDTPGQALSDVRLRVADDGEIQAKGPSVFSNYWHNPLASRAAFTADGWFRTGDIGKLHNGWLHIIGRLKFAIVLSSGLKVFPEDIELVADKHPYFKDICIVGVKRTEGETVVAIVTSDKSDKEIMQAIADINSQLESYQHIDEWRRWPDSDFPRTRLLKVDRRQVQLWANSSDTDQAIKPESAKASTDQLEKLIHLSLGDVAVPIEKTTN